MRHPPSHPRPRRRARDFSGGVLGSLFGALAGFYIWFVWNTTRWERVGWEHLDAMLGRPHELRGGFLVAFWHGRLFPIAMIRPRGLRVSAVISANRDGEIITRVLSATGIGAIRGSSRDPRKPDKDRGGAEAFAQSVQALADGVVVAVTPDGPRGPLMRVKPGIAMISAAAATPVVPMGYSVRRGRVFGTWDRFLLPWPFNRGAFVVGEPIPPADPSDPDAIERRRAAIEAAIDAATREADRLVGRETPEPGPPLEAKDLGVSGPDADAARTA